MSGQPFLSYRLESKQLGHLIHHSAACDVAGQARVGRLVCEGLDGDRAGALGELVYGGKVSEEDFANATGCDACGLTIRMVPEIVRKGHLRFPSGETHACYFRASGQAAFGGVATKFTVANTGLGLYTILDDIPPVLTRRTEHEMFGEMFTPHPMRGRLAIEFALDAGMSEEAANACGPGILVLAVRRFYAKFGSDGKSIAASYHPNLMRGRACYGEAAIDVGLLNDGDELNRTVLAQTFTMGTNHESPVHRIPEHYGALAVDRLIWTRISGSASPANEWPVTMPRDMRDWTAWAAFFSCSAVNQQHCSIAGINVPGGTHWTAMGSALMQNQKLEDTSSNAITGRTACSACPMRCPMKTAALGLEDRGGITPDMLASHVTHHSYSGLWSVYAAMGAPIDDDQIGRWKIELLRSGELRSGNSYNLPASGISPQENSSGAIRDWLAYGAAGPGRGTGLSSMAYVVIGDKMTVNAAHLNERGVPASVIDALSKSLKENTKNGQERKKRASAEGRWRIVGTPERTRGLGEGWLADNTQQHPDRQYRLVAENNQWEVQEWVNE